MTYAILTPIYGIPLRKGNGGGTVSEKMHQLLDNGCYGFMRYYCDCNDSAIAFGVRVGADITQNLHHIEASSFVTQPNEQQIADFNNFYEMLEEDIKEEMQTFGIPRVFYLLYSS